MNPKDLKQSDLQERSCELAKLLYCMLRACANMNKGVQVIRFRGFGLRCLSDQSEGKRASQKAVSG